MTRTSAHILPARRLRHLLAALSASLALAAQAQGLMEIYEAARAYDANYLSAQAQYQANLAKAEQAKAALRPQAGLAANALRYDLDSSADMLDGQYSNRELALQASQPLYRPANAAASRQGELLAEVARAQLRSAEQDLIVRTTQAYFDVLAAQDTLAFVRAQKAAVEQQLAAARRSFEVGNATVTDQREAQARYDLVLAQEIAAENDLRVKQLALDQLVGRQGVKPLPLATPVQLPPLEPADLQAWIAYTEQDHPTIVQARQALEMARLETAKAEAGHKPTLDLVAQYQVTRSPSTYPTIPGYLRNRTAAVGLQFNLPLYAGGAIQNQVREALALEDKARSDLDAARRSVEHATRSAYFGVLSGLGQVKALEAAEASSQSALEANQLGYEVGVRINIDVLNAQSQLYQTKRDLAQARYHVLLGTLRLRQASGRLAAEDLRTIDALLAR
jgi:outer membrane protein